MLPCSSNDDQSAMFLIFFEFRKHCVINPKYCISHDRLNQIVLEFVVGSHVSCISSAVLFDND